MSIALAPWRVAQSAALKRFVRDERRADAGTVDAILRSCPTAAEIAAIERDFKFTFETDPGPIVCTPGGSEYGARLALINAFRCMKALTFDKPIPVLNAANIYAWLKGHGVAINVIDAGDSNAATRTLNIYGAVLGGSEKRVWSDDRGNGMVALIGLLVHEATHAITGKGHDCSGAAWFYEPGYRTIEDGTQFEDVSWLPWPGDSPKGPPKDPVIVRPYTMYTPDGAILLRMVRAADPGGRVGSGGTPGVLRFEDKDGAPIYMVDWKGGQKSPLFDKIPEVWNNDSSLEYGGAFAAQYWYLKWLADHSTTHLSTQEKEWAAKSANDLRTGGRLSCGRLTTIVDRGIAAPTIELRKPPAIRAMTTMAPMTTRPIPTPTPTPNARLPPWLQRATIRTPLARANVGAMSPCMHAQERAVGALDYPRVLDVTLTDPRSLRPEQFAAFVGATAKAPTKWTAPDYRALAKAAKDIGTQPAYLLLVLYSESRLNTWAAAPGNHAVGLNQIVPVAGKALGMTEAERIAILNKSVQEQLPIVVRSFRLMPGKFPTPQALYQYNAAPATMSKGSADSVVVYPAGSAGFKGNAGLDYDKDGVLTVGDLRMHLEALSKQPAFQSHLAAMTAATGASSDLGGSVLGGLPPNAFEWSVAALAGAAGYYLAASKWTMLRFW